MKNDLLHIILTAVISSGIIGFIFKKIIENSIKHGFSKNLEKYKADIDIQKNLTIHVNDNQIEIYKKITEIIYRGRNTTRHIIALLGNYYITYSNEDYFKTYEKYLSAGDNIFTFRQVKKAIEEESDILDNSRKESIEISYENRILIGRLIFKYIHDYKYIIRPIIRDVEWLIDIEKKSEFIEQLKKHIFSMEKSYKTLDLYYKEIVIALQSNYGIET